MLETTLFVCKFNHFFFIISFWFYCINTLIRECIGLALCLLDNFASYFCRLLIFFKINFFKKLFQEYHQSVSLDQDQAQHFVMPIWVHTVCKGYQQTTLVGKELKLNNEILFKKNSRIQSTCNTQFRNEIQIFCSWHAFKSCFFLCLA